MQHAADATVATVERRGTRPGIVLLIASVATFLDFLDVTVVNIAFPSLQRHFPQTTLSELSWVVTAYAVVFAALLTPAGRLADVVGRKRVFLSGVAAFTLASAASAAAPSVAMLIVARALQGGAAAATIPAALGIVLASTGGGGEPASAEGAGVTLKTATIDGVTVLTSSDGFTLYWFALDTAAKSNCNGSCSHY